ncbi:MAG: TonB-dependent receptor plug domain-containing protein, partial [Paramuribaculum sp.]|nr:TonB-dependent receptor plug domain-containing protein [Paramuribaculum sp.]
GYDAVQVKAGDSVMTVLNSATNALDEVVVVGFGTQKKVNLTGSVSVADKKALESRPVTTAAQALQGVVPGLNISQSQGDLETNPSINIRGTGTIGQGSSGSPLILIDGMEGDINIINPQDIESISVLKDAAASSIYGSRAPFGVILVTTKKGSEGKATINYNNSFRLSSLMNLAKSMDSYTFATYFNDAAYNSPGTGAPFSADQLQRIKDFRDGKITTTTIPNASGMWGDYYYSNDNVDWVDTMFKDSNFSQEHNLSISGGTENINYYMSSNFLSQPGMVDWGKEGLKRYALTGKFSTQLFSWLRVGYSGRWTRINHERPSLLRDSDFYANLLRQGWPTLPL